MNTSLQELIFQALGEASMCWSFAPMGTFDDEKAKQIGNRLMNDIASLTSETPIGQRATVECEYDGKHYRGTVYEVSK